MEAVGAAPPPVRLATHAMGTRFELLVEHADRAHAIAAGEAAVEVIESMHHRFSRFDPASFVSHLRRTAGGRPVPVDADTWLLFADAALVRRASGKVFDHTLGTGGPDGGIELDAAARTVRLTSGAVELDLGAIAKGHAIDLAARLLREGGIERAFVQGGTSSGCGIGRGGTGPWRVAAAPDGAAGGPVVELTDRAFSLSSHGGARHALVAGSSARLADAWATALALGAPADGVPEAGWDVWVRRAGESWGRVRCPAGAIA